MILLQRKNIKYVLILGNEVKGVEQEIVTQAILSLKFRNTERNIR